MVDMFVLGVTLVAIIIIVAVVIAVWIVLRELTKRRVARPDHIELYFSENFRNLVDEWDLVSRTKVNSWRTDIMKRLNTVNSDIDRLKAFQKTMDNRLARLHRAMVALEK